MKKLVSFLLSIMIASAFTACASKDENSAPDTSSGASKAHVTEAPVTEPPEPAVIKDPGEKTPEDIMEQFGYNGTFSDDIFDKFVSSIVIGDVEVSYPCTLNDFVKNDDYEYDEAWGLLKYKGCEAANIYFNLPDEEDNDIYDNQFNYIRIIQANNNIARVDGIDLITSIGGIEFNEKPETILKYLGEPTRRSEKQENFYFYTYKTDDHLISFGFRNYDDTLYTITVIFTLEESEEEKETSH